MASWSEFTSAAPSLAAAIRSALHQYGAGLGYLATIRPDGGPRIHPVSPAVVGGGLYCCLLDTPKRRDLDRDSRYALHAFPAEETDDEASVRGSARLVTDPAVVRRVAAQLRAETRLDWWLYELTVDTALFVRREDESQQLWTDPRRGARSVVSEVIASEVRVNGGVVSGGVVVSGTAMCGSAAHLDLDLRRCT